MRTLLLSVWMIAASTQADCIDRVVDTRARMQAMVGDLNEADSIRLSAMLLELCREREPGSSVSRSREQTAITTYGLNPKQVVVGDSDIPVFVDIDARRNHRGDRRPDRPERKE